MKAKEKKASRAGVSGYRAFFVSYVSIFVMVFTRFDGNQANKVTLLVISCWNHHLIQNSAISLNRYNIELIWSLTKRSHDQVWWKLDKKNLRYNLDTISVTDRLTLTITIIPKLLGDKESPNTYISWIIPFLSFSSHSSLTHNQFFLMILEEVLRRFWRRNIPLVQ